MTTEHPPFAAAIVGAGFIAEYHARGIRAVPGARLAALVGRDPARTRRRAEELGAERAETDLGAVLADPGIDGVVIATPDALHREMAVRALEAGKPVLLQKPMAMNAAECAEVLAAAARSGTPLTVSFMHRYFPEVRWLRALLAEGRLGRIHAIRIRNATPGADWAPWFYDAADVAGGVVMQLGVHGIDLVSHLAGRIEGVSAAMTTARPSRRLADGRQVETKLEDNVLARYRLAGGALVTHEMSYTELAGCDRFRLELYADHGTVWLRSEKGAAAICAPEVTGRAGWVIPDLPEEPPGRAHHAHWIDIAAGRAPADDTAAAGARTVAVAEAIYAAAAREDLRPAPIDGEAAP
jgi:predicted dehydrogenase